MGFHGNGGGQDGWCRCRWGELGAGEGGGDQGLYGRGALGWLGALESMGRRVLGLYGD